MPGFRWGLTLTFLFAGAVVGAGAIVGSTEFNRRTSTDAFCTSCHSMSSVAADLHYLGSRHISNAVGVRPSCGDCHIPTTNWFVETYTHVRSGVRDVIAEFDDPKVWEVRRASLAKEVHDTMRAQDNVTCKSCHALANIKPASQAGQAAHAMLQNSKMACVDCHINLVHAPAASHSTQDDLSRIMEATDDWARLPHLANIHAQMSLSCSSCHGNDLIPDANALAINSQCVACHGTLEKVALTYKGPSYLNPHASHLGNIPCTSCHFGHQESKAYCLNCHTNFNVPIPGGVATVNPTKP
jgi:nitrate/TMAO reductase-like tetraheme cytochrome c subunit